MAINYFVIGIDVMSYSEKALSKQVYAQDLIDRVLDISLEKYPQFSSPIWIDGGDGGYLLISGEVKSVINFIEEFQTSLGRENSNLQEESKAYVRCAIHHDLIDVRRGKLGMKYTGNAINLCARLLTGMPRNANQVVSSKNFITLLTSFDDQKEVITRLKDITDKHGNKHQMYNLKRDGMGIVPTSEVHPDPLERFYPPGTK